ESEAKPFTAAFVPRGCFHDIILSLRSYNYTPSHWLKRERMRAFDSSSGIDESGSARWLANLDSTNASSAADIGGSSSSMALLIRSWRSSKVRFGSSSRTCVKLMLEVYCS